MIKKQILILITVGILGTLFYFGVNSYIKEGATMVEIGNKKFTVTLANTPSEREQGLSGAISLGTNKGMLFDFEKPGIYGFWMKDMNFPLDIIWITEDFKIAHIEHSLAPETYPVIYKPSAPARYVLEVNAGLAKKHGWKIGDLVKF